MRHALLLLIAASLALSGCAISPASSTWGTVRASRLNFGGGGSEAYAEHLAAELKQARVPHKVVTYEYRYRTLGGDEAIATRTAVLYRAGSDSRNPWWLMEDRLRAPVWVPGEDLDHQVSFYVRRPATVVSVNGQSLDDGKAQRAELREEPRMAIARLIPVRPVERSRKYPMVAKKCGTEKIPAKYLALFRARHGSAFDRASVADRLKMDRLMNSQRTLARR